MILINYKIGREYVLFRHADRTHPQEAEPQRAYRKVRHCQAPPEIIPLKNPIEAGSISGHSSGRQLKNAQRWSQRHPLHFYLRDLQDGVVPEVGQLGHQRYIREDSRH